ncbi:MAG TPA: arginine repressor, partial [Prevotella sp.]|nr:arginine repressor [Prevotella sp.]
SPQSAMQMIQSPGFLSLNFSGNIGVIKTRPGYASSIAYNIDNARLPEILGTIAGDDTIFIVKKDDSSEKVITDELMSVIPNL